MNPELKLKEKVQKYRSDWTSREKEKARDRAYHQQKGTDGRKLQVEKIIDGDNFDDEKREGLETVTNDMRANEN